MKQRVIVALLTVLIFGAGFGAGLWSERHRPLPPPPAPIMGEFTSAQPADKNAKAGDAKATQNAPKPYNRAQLVADIEKLRPQIDAYRARLEAIDHEFDTAFAQVLNPEQRQILDAKHAKDQKRRADFESKAMAAPHPPLSEDEIARLRQRPYEIAFWKVSFKSWLEQAVKDYKLDAQQEAAVHQLLLTRRENFLALTDSVTPPTFKLTALATSIKPLIDPAAPPKTAK